jgi:drug/metabolite transporter (DMT)-like permease
VAVERFANRYDSIALTFVEMVTALIAFLAIAVALGDLGVPRGWTVWGALLVTGVFASALAYLIQVWAQRRMSASRIALVFSLETVFAGLFGYALAGDRLGALGWGGCAAILAGIVLAEPAAAVVLRRLVPRGDSTRTRRSPR